MKEQWIKRFKNSIKSQGIHISEFSDDEIFEIGKAIIAPELCRQLNIKDEWLYDLWFDAIIKVTPPPGMSIFEDVNIDMLKQRIDAAKN